MLLLFVHHIEALFLACRSIPTMVTTCLLAYIAFVFMESLYSLVTPKATHPGDQGTRYPIVPFKIVKQPAKLHTYCTKAPLLTSVCFVVRAMVSTYLNQQ